MYMYHYGWVALDNYVTPRANNNRLPQRLQLLDLLGFTVVKGLMALEGNWSDNLDTK